MLNIILQCLKYFANISKVTQKKEHQVQNRALINLNKQLAEKLLYYKSFKTQFDKNYHLDTYHTNTVVCFLRKANWVWWLSAVSRYFSSYLRYYSSQVWSQYLILNALSKTAYDSDETFFITL